MNTSTPAFRAVVSDALESWLPPNLEDAISEGLSANEVARRVIADTLDDYNRAFEEKTFSAQPSAELMAEYRSILASDELVQDILPVVSIALDNARDTERGFDDDALQAATLGSRTLAALRDAGFVPLSEDDEVAVLTFDGEGSFEAEFDRNIEVPGVTGEVRQHIHISIDEDGDDFTVDCDTAIPVAKGAEPVYLDELRNVPNTLFYNREDFEDGIVGADELRAIVAEAIEASDFNKSNALESVLAGEYVRLVVERESASSTVDGVSAKTDGSWFEVAAPVPDVSGAVVAMDGDIDAAGSVLATVEIYLNGSVVQEHASKDYESIGAAVRAFANEFRDVLENDRAALIEKAGLSQEGAEAEDLAAPEQFYIIKEVGGAIAAAFEFADDEARDEALPALEAEALQKGEAAIFHFVEDLDDDMGLGPHTAVSSIRDDDVVLANEATLWLPPGWRVTAANGVEGDFAATHESGAKVMVSDRGEFYEGLLNLKGAEGREFQRFEGDHLFEVLSEAEKRREGAQLGVERLPVPGAHYASTAELDKAPVVPLISKVSFDVAPSQPNAGTLHLVTPDGPVDVGVLLDRKGNLNGFTPEGAQALLNVVKGLGEAQSFISDASAVIKEAFDARFPVKSKGREGR